MLPPAGLTEQALERAQKWIRGNCNRLDPPYQPTLSPELLDGRHLLVVWVPPSDTKPHRAPDGEKGPRRYWVRLGAETVNAEKKPYLSRMLMEQTARVTWDDCRAMDATLEDLREAKVREFLRDTGSGLINEPNARVVYERLRITARANGHEVPRNVGLLFFSHDPRCTGSRAPGSRWCSLQRPSPWRDR